MTNHTRTEPRTIELTVVMPVRLDRPGMLCAVEALSFSLRTLNDAIARGYLPFGTGRRAARLRARDAVAGGAS